MPPKKKATKPEWIECSKCNCLVSSRDVTNHSELCTGDLYRNLNQSWSGNRAHGHGFIETDSDTLYAVVHSRVEKADERLPTKIQQNLVQVNPVTMRMCHLSIGKPVCLSIKQCQVICTAWPVATIPPSYVGIDDKLKRMYCIQNNDVLAIRRLHCPVHTVSELILASRNNYNFLKEKEFKSFFLQHFVDKFITIGNKLQITYFGKPCTFKIIGITGPDGSLVSVSQSKDEFDSEDFPADQSELSFSNITASIGGQSELSLSLAQNLDESSKSCGESSESDKRSENPSILSPDSVLDESELSAKFQSLDLEHDATSTPCRTTRKISVTPGPFPEDDVTQREAKQNYDLKVFTISSRTKLTILTLKDNKNSQENSNKKSTVGYSNIGGLSKQLDILKEMVELPLKSPEVFENLGIVPPRGVLLFGPPGTGKTLLARAIANETKAYFTTINGPEVLSKFYGESESKLRGIFQEASSHAPAVVFIDEIDALCPKRDNVHSELEKRIVATLLTLMDGISTMESKGHVIVLGATNRPDSIDAALRRPGRFDRDIEIGIPNAKDRKDILEKQLVNMPHNLNGEDVEKISDSCHGYVGADLSALCKEAALHAFKRCKSLPTASTDEMIGQTLIQRNDFAFALKEVKPSAMREITIDVPKVLWSDIGGQIVVKQKLRQAVEWPLRHPEVFQRMGIQPPQGVLLYGPPGCSKTMIVKALATETRLNFIAVKGPELFSKWVGESERAVREVFRKARAAAPSIVFFDEIDALAVQRGSSGGSSQVADRVVAQLLTELDGIEKLSDVTIVAATNRPDMIDKALMRPGRIDRILYIPLPDSKTRKEILQIQFNKMPIGSDVNLDELVCKTEKYSGAEVVAVCHEAALSAMQEDIRCEWIMQRHFDQALKAVTPRINDELIAEYEHFEEKSGLHSV
ncbi:ATPase family gene 2 protein homolog A-like [Glandiceps talaboti]